MTWLAIAATFAVLGGIYFTLGEIIDAVLELWRARHDQPAGELGARPRPSLAESAGMAYFGAHGAFAASVTAANVSGLGPDDVELVEARSIGRHLELAPNPSTTNDPDLSAERNANAMTTTAADLHPFTDDSAVNLLHGLADYFDAQRRNGYLRVPDEITVDELTRTLLEGLPPERRQLIPYRLGDAGFRARAPEIRRHDAVGMNRATCKRS